MGERSQRAELAVSLLRSGQPIRLRVSGWSMKPLLPSGAVLRIVPFAERPQVGDIVLCQGRDGKLVTHRVVASTKDSVRTKGDACAQPDGLQGLSQVLGRVIAVEEPWPLSLDGHLARLLGRLIGQAYPLLVKLKMALTRCLPCPGESNV